ncbi:hypothetical protein [Nocardia amamiensis]|uniref:hypothetical protein n=1 Tax=Nocardia amamiensis TaxID=404578 RepID=UPI0012F51172|nr:hypothetical protein [Nocardia amamiensis]
MAVAAVVTVVAVRDDAAPQGPQTTTASENSSGGPTFASSFVGSDKDSFGHRFDIPNDPAGQALSQSGSPRTPTDPEWQTGAPGGTNQPGGWQQVYGGPIIPFSTTDGPVRIDNGVPSGFAKTPQGAALAAEQIYWRTVARPTDNALWQQLVILTPEELADRERKIAGGKVPNVLPESVKPLLYASHAFRIESYGDDFAVVRIARKTREFLHGGRSWVAMRLNVVWRDGGWRLKSSAGDAQPLETIGSIDGWTQW